MTTTASTGQEEGPAMSSLCCPCSDLVSIECIYRALSSEERSRSLMDWLSGKKSTRCIDGNSKDCQVRKVNASFSVLNAIRAACRPHLEAASSHKTGKSPAKQNTEPASAKTKAKPSYEETFPSLSSTASSSSSSKPPAGNSSTANDSNNQAVKDKTENANNTKKKKRIRPVAALTPVGGASGVWGNIAKQKPIEPTNNHFLSSTTAATAKLNGNNTGVWSGRTLNLPSENGTRKQPIQSPTRQRNNPPLSNRNDIFPQFSKSNSSAHSDGGGAWGTYDKSQGQSAAIQQSRPNNNAMQQPPPTCTPNKEFQNYSPETPPLHTADSKDTSTQQSAKEIIALSNKVAASPRTKIKPADHDNINRFVDVYCTLIWSNLVPSTALEVHLLLRLLHISNNQESSSKTSTTTDNMEDVLVLAPIFPDASYCQSFAAKALSKLSILLKHFGLTFLQDLVKSPIFRNQLPDVTKELEQAIKDQMAATGGLLTPPDQGSIISGGSQTALLTLPFQHERDSRHNFKSRDDMQLYKNREESRDAFLYQLRAFLNVRGKMLDTVQAQKAIQKIRTSSRVVVDGIMSVNLPWFTQFFCELLLQVGLVPFEETDKELLDIAGKEKLQVSAAVLLPSFLVRHIYHVGDIFVASDHMILISLRRNCTNGFHPRLVGAATRAAGN